MEKKELTKAEEQVMQILWGLEKSVLKNIVEKFPVPRPATTTVSTVIRVLVKKGFIGFNTYGKINEYYPLISKNDYLKRKVKPIITNYLNKSPSAFASYFTEAKLNISELEQIKKLIEEKIKKLKQKRN
jgi:BlaI family transcriptional regulator, penicillinase repressor